MTMNMTCIVMHCIHCFIITFQILVYKFLNNLHGCIFITFIFFKRNYEMIPLPFICFSKKFFCSFHIFICVFFYAINTSSK